MSAGITRIHGTVIAPSQRPSTITFYTIDFGVDMSGQVGVVDGAFEQAIRACQGFATVAMIGTLNDDGGTGQTIRIAIEDTGADALSPSYLGTGNDNAGTNGDGATTALALRTLIRALGTINGKNLTGTTVTLFTL